MRMRSIGGFVALALTLALTGACGGGDDGGAETGDGGQAASDGGGSDGRGSGNEFCDQLDALPNNGFAFNFSEPETVQQQVEGLAAIEPPAEIADEYNRLIADYVQMVDPDAPDTGDIEEGDEDVVREYVMHTCPDLF